MEQYIAVVRQYFRFNKKEVRDLLITSIVLAFVVSFRDWGKGDSFDAASGVLNLFNAFLVILLVVLVAKSAQKLIGLAAGYEVQYEMWMNGLIVALVLSFITRGYFWFLPWGNIIVHHMTIHRLGRFRYGLSYFYSGVISALGPASAVILAMLLFKPWAVASGIGLLSKAVNIALLMALWNMLPLPQFDGLKVFFGSRLTYAFSVGAIVCGCIMVWLNVPWYFIIIFSIIIGFLVWLIYYITYERHAWNIDKA